ncbi:YihY/virulence factor BrkB family protein [Moheibacter stercoris]|uniref:Membrane protein n=1 Tax=Moheibacter stercoris TaxID=1628251 RepID=A0ABV2LT17_9FLAO
MINIRNKFTLEYWKNMAHLIYKSAMGFIDDKCMKMAASLAYYTLFSLGPLLLIVIWCIGFFYGERVGNYDAKKELMSEMTDLFGIRVALQIQSIIEKLSLETDSNVGLMIGIGTLIFTSTTIFVEIQDSINTIWGVKPKPKKGWLKFILNRLLSLSMVLGLGFLLITSLMVNSIVMLMTEYINKIFPAITLSTLNWINNGITFLVIALLFGCIFKILPDAKVNNKHIIGGAIFTAILFMLGQYGISMYLQFNATASTFGAAGSVIILLLWVYFSAAILYFGAEFTKEHAKFYDNGIKPSSFAVLVAHTEIAVKTGKDTDVEKGEILKEKNESKNDDIEHPTPSKES